MLADSQSLMKFRNANRDFLFEITVILLENFLDSLSIRISFRTELTAMIEDTTREFATHETTQQATCFFHYRFIRTRTLDLKLEDYQK